MIRILFLATILIGCGTDHKSQPYPMNAVKDSDPFFTETIEEIQEVMKAVAGQEIYLKTPVFFANDMPENVFAYCNGGGESITVNQEIYENYNDPNKKDLLFYILLHEFGHCDFDIRHRQEMMYLDRVDSFWWPEDNFQPSINQRFTEIRKQRVKSIMWPTIYSTANYEGMKQYYVAEILGKGDQIEKIKSIQYVEDWRKQRPFSKNLYTVKELNGEIVTETENQSVAYENMWDAYGWYGLQAPEEEPVYNCDHE